MIKDEVFKIELLNCKSLSKIIAGLVEQVCHVFMAHFLLLSNAMILSFVRQAIT